MITYVSALAKLGATDVSQQLFPFHDTVHRYGSNYDLARLVVKQLMDACNNFPLGCNVMFSC